MQDEILSQLKDVHLPESPSFWPLPLGYYLVLALLVLLVAMLFLAKRLFKRSPSIKKQAWSEFKLIEERFLVHGDNQLLQTELNQLVRRLAIGDLSASIEYLWPKHKKNQHLSELLSADRFKAVATIDGQQLLNLFREQLKSCRR